MENVVGSCECRFNKQVLGSHFCIWKRSCHTNVTDLSGNHPGGIPATRRAILVLRSPHHNRDSCISCTSSLSIQTHRKVTFSHTPSRFHKQGDPGTFRPWELQILQHQQRRNADKGWQVKQQFVVPHSNSRGTVSFNLAGPQGQGISALGMWKL